MRRYRILVVLLMLSFSVPAIAQGSEDLRKFSEQTGFAAPLDSNYIELFDDSTFFPALLGAMEEAREYILMEFYIFREDTVSTRILDLLARKVAEGVECHAVFDYVGCALHYEVKGERLNVKAFHDGFLEHYIDQGVDIELFNPHMRLPRNHRKLVIIDGLQAFTGCMNVTDLYEEGLADIGHYHDKSVMVAGPAVAAFHEGFARTWKACGRTPLAIAPRSDIGAAGGISLVIMETQGKKSKPLPIDMVRAVLDSAQDSLKIICPFIWPDRKLRRALVETAARGVEIKILMGSASDMPGILDAGLNMQTKRLARQDNIHLYVQPASFHHEKVMVVDDRLLWLGSHNLDRLSMNRNMELALLMYDAGLIEYMTSYFWECAQIEK